MLLLALPAYQFIGSGNTGLIFLGLLFIAVLLNCMTGVMASTLPALFPTRIRLSALAISSNVAIVIAGLTPTVAAWLVEETENLMMRGDTPNASNKHEAKASNICWARSRSCGYLSSENH